MLFRSEDNRCRDSFDQDGQLAIGPTNKWCGNKEKIDRHVRQNEERHERDPAFPFKIKRTDVRTTRCDPVAAPVNDQEQDGQSGRDDKRFAKFNGHGVRPKP